MAYFEQENIEDDFYAHLLDSILQEGEPISITSSEFQHAGEEELEQIILKNVNGNTKRSTDTWIKRYSKWATERSQPIDISCLHPVRLDSILQKFYAELRKKNGDEYEPESLKVMQTALDSRKVLYGKAIELHEMGKGKRPMKGDAINEDEEDHLWNSGVLGNNDPVSLNHTMFFFIQPTFWNSRTSREHHQIMIQDLKIVRDSATKDIAYAERIEGPTKTRKAGLNKRPRPLTQKLLRTGGPRCPVMFFEKLSSKRPPSL